MNANIKQLKEMKNIDIYNCEVSFINNICKDYDFLELEEKKLKSIILHCIDKSITIFDSKTDYLTCLEEIIREEFSSMIESEIEQITEEDITKIESDEFVDTKMEMFDIYMSEISKAPLLTAEEEKMLAMRISNGDEEARKIFIERNLKLVVKIAKRYCSNRGLDLLDLIQEGNVGLMTAVEKFDPSKKCKFSTYATYWIIQTINRGIAEKGRTVRIPVHIHDQLKSYMKQKEVLEQTSKRQLTLSELAIKMGISIDKVNQFEILINNTFSIDEYLKSDSDCDTTFGEMIPDSSIQVEELAIQNTLKDEVNQLLNSCNLTKKEINIISLRYGIGIDKRKTLEEISKIYGVTIERIRMLEAKVLKKLRNSSEIIKFAAYTDNPSKSANYIQKYQRGRRHDIQVQHINKQTNNMCEIKTLYDYFEGYSQAQVNESIGYLQQEDRNIIDLVYNEELCTVREIYINNEFVMNKFTKEVIPKLKRILMRLYGINKFQNDKSIYDEKYLERIQNAFNNEKIVQLFRNFSIREVLTISLKLGYIDIRVYTPEQIATTFEVPRHDVVEIINAIFNNRNTVQFMNDVSEVEGKVKKKSM